MAVTKVLIPSEARPLTGAPAYREVCLGRRPPTKRGRAPALSAYLTRPRTAPLPATVDYWSKAKDALSRMYLNDQYGDCVIAAKGHALGVWSGNESGAAVQATDAEIEATYRDWCGPDDTGCVITDVLDKMKANGFPAGGKAYPIDDYVAVDWTNRTEVQTALDLFGALTVGINLPQEWADGATAGGTWDTTDSQIVGGHDVTAVGYTAQGVQISTWGLVPPITITWQALLARTWIDECYALLAPLWYANADLAPSGVDVATLKADLATLAAGQIPNIGPAPTPTPGPNPAPTPPAPVPVPVGPTVLTGTTAPTTVTVALPVGFLGRTQQVQIPIPALAVTVSGPAAVRAAVPWGTILALVARYGRVALPIVLADVEAGKPWPQIVTDVLDALAA